MTMVATLPPVLQADHRIWGSMSQNPSDWTIEDSLSLIASDEWTTSWTSTQTNRTSNRQQTDYARPHDTSCASSVETTVTVTSNYPHIAAQTQTNLTDQASCEPSEQVNGFSATCQASSIISQQNSLIPKHPTRWSSQNLSNWTATDLVMSTAPSLPVTCTGANGMSWTTATQSSNTNTPTSTLSMTVSTPSVACKQTSGVYSDKNNGMRERTQYTTLTGSGGGSSWAASQGAWASAAVQDNHQAGRKRCRSDDTNDVRGDECEERLLMDDDDDTITDPEVKAAGDQALKTGSMAPIIKSILKNTVKKRRLQMGKPELPDDDLFREPPSYELTEEEERKIRERKERNRRAAHKSRLMKKERHASLKKQNKILQAKNDRLKDDVGRLKEALTQRMQAVYEVRICNHSSRRINVCM